MHSDFIEKLATTERAVKRFVAFFSLGTVVFLTLSLSLFFLLLVYNKYTQNVNDAKKHVESLQQESLKQRVQGAVDMIETARKMSEITVQNRVQARVDNAYMMASAIYENNKNTLSESQIKTMIIAALRPLRWNEGRSYVFITDYEGYSRLSPNAPSREGTFIGQFKSPNGNFVVKNQATIAKTHKQGFSKDCFKKLGFDQKKCYPQIAFVKDFGHYGWYFGSAEFIDDYEAELKKTLLTQLSTLQWGDEYIFITQFDGNALLMNGKYQQKPVNIASLTDKRGKKIFAEEYATALKGGGFLSYFWYEEKLRHEIESLTYVQAIPNWGWIIGSFIPLNTIDLRVSALEKEFFHEMMTTLSGALIISLLFGASLFPVLRWVNRKIALFATQTKNELTLSYSHLDKLNTTLEEKADKALLEATTKETLYTQVKLNWDALFESNSSALFIVDEERTIIDVNVQMCTLFGYKKEEMVGKNAQLIHVDKAHYEQWQPYFIHAQSRYSIEKLEYPGRHKDGHSIWCMVSGTRIRLENNTIGILWSINDISELKKNSQMLKELNETLEMKVHDEVTKNREKDFLLIQQSRFAAMGEMIANIAHQWRQPLNSLGIIIQNIRDSYNYNELTDEYLTEHENKAMHLLTYMSQTIDDFRNFFRPDKKREPFNVLTVLQNAETLFAPSFKLNNITLEWQCPDPTTAINGFGNEFAQVFINIIKNAQDVFCERQIHEGKIVVSIVSDEKSVTITLEDNAGGIDETILSKIFDPYFTTKHQSQGTGIGLYMSRMIVEHMNGTLTANNTPQGAIFTLCFPPLEKLK